MKWLGNGWRGISERPRELWREVRMAWRASPAVWQPACGVVTVGPAMVVLSYGVGKDKESSALSNGIASASRASSVGGGVEVGGFGEQLGACGTTVRARYNIQLNPDTQRQAAASRHLLRAC